MDKSFEGTLKSLVTSAKNMNKYLSSVSKGHVRLDLVLEDEGIELHLSPSIELPSSPSKVEGIVDEVPSPEVETPPVKKKRHRRTKAQIAADNAKAEAEAKAKAEDIAASQLDPAEDVLEDDPAPADAKSDPAKVKEEEIPSEDDFLSETVGGEDDDNLGDLSEESAGTDDIFDAAEDDDNSLEGLPEDFEGDPEPETAKVAETAGAGGDSSLDDLLEI